MKRKVECQQKERRVIFGRGPTPDTGDLAPDITKIEFMMLFYDAGEMPAHRNVYQIFLTPEEADKYEVGKIYTLNIG